MSENTRTPTDPFAEAVTKFVDDFVGGATTVDIDRFLEEGGADFYNKVQSPSMVAPVAGTLCMSFHGSFWALIAAPSSFQTDGDFTVGDWQVREPYACSDRADLALAA